MRVRASVRARARVGVGVGIRARLGVWVWVGVRGRGRGRVTHGRRHRVHHDVSGGLADREAGQVLAHLVSVWRGDNLVTMEAR